MILVDTSVLIDFLQSRNNPKTKLFEDVLNKRLPWGINTFIYQEILQGARNKKAFKQLQSYFETVPLYDLRHGKQSFESAAFLNIQCRNAGITIRSTIDLLIAQTAIEHDLLLLHNDRDFDRMNRVISALRLYDKSIL